VRAIVALVPAGASQRENEALAETLVSFTAADRARFAAGAGCKRPPSDTTWALVVDAVRARGEARRAS
jgi:hypothetical protein